MEELRVALTEKYNSGVYILESTASISDISGLAEQFGLRFVYVDGSGISKGREFLDAAAKALNVFPIALGWDALLDYMRDLYWFPADRGYLFLYDDIQTFAQGDRHFFDITIDTLRYAADFWKTTMQNSKFMYILLRGDPKIVATLAGIPTLSRAGSESPDAPGGDHSASTDV